MIQKLVNEGMEFELTGKGLGAIREESLPPEAIAQWNLETDPYGETAILELGRVTRADFAILCLYAGNESVVRMSFLCYDIEAGMKAASTEELETITLLVDEGISKAFSTILTAIKSRLVPIPQAPPSEKPPSTMIEPVTIERPFESGTAALENMPGIATVLESPSPPSEPEQAAPAEEAAKAVSTSPPVSSEAGHFEITVGLAPFLALGRGADYFKTGFSPSISFRYRLDFPIGALCLGISTGTCYFYAESTTVQSVNFLVPVAADFAFRTNAEDSLANFSAHISLGMAGFAANPNATYYRWKLLPYASGGFGFYIFNNHGFEILLGLTFSAYFEDGDPIMGYMPSVNIGLGL